MRKLIAISLFTFFICSTVLADDIQPPWWRGEWSTTWQYWEFSTDNSAHVKPDGPGLLIDDPIGPPYEEPGYLPSTEIVYIEPGPEMEWIDMDSTGRQGIWPLSGWMDVIVDNHPTPNPWKIMWVQITWRPQDVGEVPILEMLDPAAHPDHMPEIVLEEALGECWTETTYTWWIPDNPPDESFRISGTVDVDQLVIDTWCVPEPATIALLGLGGLLLCRRKR